MSNNATEKTYFIVQIQAKLEVPVHYNLSSLDLYSLEGLWKG